MRKLMITVRVIAVRSLSSQRSLHCIIGRLLSRHLTTLSPTRRRQVFAACTATVPAAVIVGTPRDADGV